MTESRKIRGLLNPNSTLVFQKCPIFLSTESLNHKHADTSDRLHEHIYL